MALFLIAYDLDQPGQDYDAFYAQLREWGAERVLRSSWMLNTILTTEEIRDKLSGANGLLDSNDRLVVVRIKMWSSFRPMADIHEIEHSR